MYCAIYKQIRAVLVNIYKIIDTLLIIAEMFRKVRKSPKTDNKYGSWRISRSLFQIMFC